MKMAAFGDRHSAIVSSAGIGALAGMWVAAVGAGLLHAQPTTPLAQAVRVAAARNVPVWITYRAPIVPGPRTLCFETMRSGRGDAGDLRLATPGASELMVFARVNGNRIERVRAFTPDCPVDAGDTPVVRVAGVSAAESVAWLASIAAAPDGDAHRVIEPALLALSLHADPAALTRLIAIARDDPRSRVRGQALFWLAERAGDRALATIAGAVDNDPDTEVKKRAVFALSQLPKDEGVPKLIEIARQNHNPVVRKQAMFWLGQSNDPRAIGFFEEILRR